MYVCMCCIVFGVIPLIVNILTICYYFALLLMLVCVNPVFSNMYLYSFLSFYLFQLTMCEINKNKNIYNINKGHDVTNKFSFIY